MDKVLIRVVKKIEHEDLKELYENPINNHCTLNLGDEFISIDGVKPDGFCFSAWDNIGPFVRDLANGKRDFFEGWMKNPKTAVISCNDGIRPVSFYLEALDEKN